MGEVFLADDTKLQRKVALKFLPEKFSSDPEFKSRFEHEARAAAALNHPNIITVYDLGEHAGRLYIAMEHVAGHTLAELIDTDQISVRKALDLAAQICDGLGAAHTAGIVHRDIKPANILVDESGRARILDFGLAKSRHATTETKVGSTLGTVQYESPEQSRGEQVDNRSDLFSFGSVLYEMITGKLPFPGEYDEAIRYAISHEVVEPLTRYKSSVPADLENVVAKLLEKEPEMRYQTASGVIADLKRIQRDLTQATPAISRIVPTPSDTPTAPSASPEGTSGKKFILPTSIAIVVIALALVFKPWKFDIAPTQEARAAEDRLAIMYFDNLADPNDSLRQGEIVANLLIADISASTQLKVVSSQRLYDILKLLGKEGVKKIDRDVASQVADKAKARWMLTGSILRSEPTVVLTAQLVEVESGNILTSTRIDGAEGEDIFSMVDKLTSGITKHLVESAVATIESPPVADLTTTSAEAYRYYLDGWDLFFKYKYAKSADAFERAIELDSTFAMAYYCLSGLRNGEENIERAVALIERVGEMDRLMILARQASIHDELGAAIGLLEELILKYPVEKMAYFQLAIVYKSILLRDFEKSSEMFEKVIEIDPTFKEAYNHLAYDYEQLGQFDKSLQAINKYIELAPNEPNPYDSRAELLARAGRLEEAVESYNLALSIDADFTQSKLGLAYTRLWLGDFDKAERMFQEIAGYSHKLVRKDGRWGRVHVALAQGRLQEASRRAELAIETDAVELYEGKVTDIHRAEGSQLAMIAELTGQSRLYDSLYSLLELALQERLTDSTERPFSIGGNVIGLAVTAAAQGKRTLAHSYLTTLGDHLDTSVYLMKLFSSMAHRDVDYLLRDYEDAIQESQWIYEEEKVFPALYSRGQLYLKAGRIAEAVEALEGAEMRHDGLRRIDPIASVRVHYYLGQAYEASGWNDKAIQKYQQFLHFWRDADDDILDLRDTRERLAALKT